MLAPLNWVQKPKTPISSLPTKPLVAEKSIALDLEKDTPCPLSNFLPMQCHPAPPSAQRECALKPYIQGNSLGVIPGEGEVHLFGKEMTSKCVALSSGFR